MERHHFETELQALRNQLLTMGGLVEERVHRAVHALVHRREEEAQRIIATDKEINDLQMDIDNRCLKLLATQTPLAVDLRLITSAMKINADLERVGDQAVNVAENVLVLLPHPPVKPLIDIPRMAVIAEKMVKDALDAVRLHSFSASAWCRTSFASAMKMTSSAMLVAWSAMRSRFRLIRMRDSARWMVPGSAIM
jgi:phosphate transport system protein